MDTLSRGVIINLTANTLLSTVLRLQAERGLSNEEMELVVSKVMSDVTAAKSLEYANKIVELTAQIQALNKVPEEETHEET